LIGNDVLAPTREFMPLPTLSHARYVIIDRLIAFDRVNRMDQLIAPYAPIVSWLLMLIDMRFDSILDH